MKILSQLGFGMAEGAIGMGVMAGVAVLGMKVADMSNSSRGTQEAKISGQALMAQIAGYLENGDSCRNTLSGQDAAAGGSITEVKNKFGATVFTVGNKYDGVTLLSLSLVPPNPDNGSYLNLPARLGFVDLMAKLKAKPSSGGTEITKKVRMWVMTNAIGSSIIQKCSSTVSATDSLWLRSYWDAANIFYEGGRIGTGGPVGSNTQDLIVLNGKLQVATIDNKKMQIESSSGGPTYKIRAMDNLTVAFINNVTNSYVDLVVGGLVPNQEIRVGQRLEPCVGSLLGAIRFNTNINKTQVCSRVESNQPPPPLTTNCLEYSTPEPMLKVTFKDSGTPRPYQRATINNSTTGPWGAFVPSGSSCPVIPDTTLVRTPYRCASNGNPSTGSRYCIGCGYEKYYALPDNGNPGDPDYDGPEAGDTVDNPLMNNGVSYEEVSGSRVTQTPPAECIEFEFDMTGYTVSPAYKWISTP